MNETKNKDNYALHVFLFLLGTGALIWPFSMLLENQVFYFSYIFYFIVWLAVLIMLMTLSRDKNKDENNNKNNNNDND